MIGLNDWAMLIESRKGAVQPDYFRVYLKTRTGVHAADQGTDDGYEARLEATSPGFVYVGTLKKYSTTPLRVEVHNAAPEHLGDEWQHVAEVSLIGDGRIDVLSWPGEVAFSVPTPTGPLRLRAMWAGLEPGLTEGLPAEGDSSEHLQLQLWPAPPAERRVLRWWSKWKLPPRSAIAPDGRRQVEGNGEIVPFIREGLRSLPLAFGLRTGTPPPPLPGGPSGSCSAIWGDPRDGKWWVDGYDVRRTFRVASNEEVRDLVR